MSNQSVILLVMCLTTILTITGGNRHSFKMSLRQSKSYGIASRINRSTPVNTINKVTVLAAEKRNYGIGSRIIRPPNKVTLEEDNKVVSSRPSQPVQNIEEEVKDVITVIAPTALEVELVSSPPNLATQTIEEETKEIGVISVDTQDIEPLSPEEVFLLRISEEDSSRSRRIQELSLLQNELMKSVNRKDEVESLMKSEIESLRKIILREIDNEEMRLKQLNQFYETFKSTLLSKTTLLQSELKVLDQMREVKKLIAEDVILSQLEDAVKKKVNIDRSKDR